MITRFLSSATAGLAVTTVLLYAMQLLIASGEEILTEPRLRHDLDFIDPPEPPDSPVEPRPPERIDPPMPPPPTPVGPPGNEQIGVHIPLPPPAPPTGRPALTTVGVTDSPLINLFNVKPQYPAAAAARGLEGTVLVRFDVTELGTVANVVVLESTNRIFNKAAINAAYRCRYKPKTIDGVKYGATGLRKLFTFEIEQ
ncbi:MAG: energy transducer TonB [Woeseia sp.]